MFKLLFKLIKKLFGLGVLVVVFALIMAGKTACTSGDNSSNNATSENATVPYNGEVSTLAVPEVDMESITSATATLTEAYYTVNDNMPYFTADELTTVSYESYSELDALGRCGVAMACIGTDIMPTEERGNIGNVKPTGWHTVKYAGIVDGNYLYNRCHLIAFCLAGENANVKNLITGTRYMNVTGMLPFETATAKYMDNNPDNHVMYRVTPIFTGDNLVADGVLMEAYSVEDNGAGICFCVYCPNIQPGITINYANGISRVAN